MSLGPSQRVLPAFTPDCVGFKSSAGSYVRVLYEALNKPLNKPLILGVGGRGVFCRLRFLLRRLNLRRPVKAMCLGLRHGHH